MWLSKGESLASSVSHGQTTFLCSGNPVLDFLIVISGQTFCVRPLFPTVPNWHYEVAPSHITYITINLHIRIDELTYVPKRPSVVLTLHVVRQVQQWFKRNSSC